MTVPRPLVRAAQMAVALILIWLLLRSVSFSSLWSMRDRIDLRLWPVAIVLILAIYALGGISLLVLLQAPASARRALLLAYGHVQSIAFFTPAQAGEALLPLLFWRRAGMDPGETAAGLIVQRLVTLAITVAIAMLFAARKVPPGTLPLLAAAAAVAVLGMAWLIRSRARFRRLASFLDSVERAGRRILLEHRSTLALHVALMVVRFAVGVGASWVMCRSFGMEVSFLEIGGLTAAVVLAALVPLAPAGLGVTEGIYVATLRSRFAVEQILGACLAGRLLSVVLLATFALIYLAAPSKDLRAP